MRINDKGYFESDKGATGVYAKRTRGRWQYRMNGPKGTILASGMSPAEFVRSFWHRDDYQESA